MSFASVCVAWMADLTTNVVGLQAATVPVENQHLYASWSVEMLATMANGRHVAVYPNADVETPIALVTEPADMDTTRYTVLVWEDASSDVARMQDDDTENAAWLSLYEAVKARFRVKANAAGAASLGGAGNVCRYVGGSFDLKGMVRLINIQFEVRTPGSYT